MSHMVILAVVYADDAGEALAEAKGVFDGLTENQSPFDYYKTFDEDGGMVAGRDRWGNLPVAAKADSPEGKKLLEDVLAGQKRDLFEYLDYVRKGLARFTNDDFWNEARLTEKEVEQNREPGGEMAWDAQMTRHFMRRAGAYRGPSVSLYTDDGEGILTQPKLDRVLNEYAEGRTVWVVPADVHH